MSSSTLTKVVVLAAVIIVAASIIYPKLVKPATGMQQSIGGAAQSAEQAAIAPENQADMPVSGAQTPAEKALSGALKSGRPTMILFHSTTCIPCKEMSTIVAQVKLEHKEAANFVDVVVDDQTEANLISEFGVNTIPTSVFFDKTGELVGKHIGVIEKDKLSELLSGLEK